MATLAINTATVLAFADAVLEGQEIAADLMVGIANRNEEIATSIARVHELMFTRGLKLRNLSPREAVRLNRRKIASQAVTLHEDRMELAKQELAVSIACAEQGLLHPTKDELPEVLTAKIAGYRCVLAELECGLMPYSVTLPTNN